METLIKAVHAKEVDSFFKRIGIEKDVEFQKIRCFNCGEIITSDNFQAITKKNGKIVVSCSKDECYRKLAQ
jgi:hypothetical protein